METLNPAPVIIHYTEDEEYEITIQALEARRNNNEEEYERLLMLLPGLPEIMNFFKREFGLQYILDAGLNLSKTIDQYGEQWLYE